MREKYFTINSIRQKSQEMLASISQLKLEHSLTFEPEKSALIVVDMQKYFLDPASHAYIPSAPSIIKGVNELIGRFNLRKRPIIFTRHLNSAGDAKLIAKWWKDIIKKENPLSEIVDDLDVSNAAVLEKSQYDAFYKTPLEDILKTNGVSQIVICGVMTHLCCETTARSAFVRGFEVFFTVDGTATYSKDFHLATLLNLAHGFATPVLVKEMLTLLREKDES